MTEGGPGDDLGAVPPHLTDDAIRERICISLKRLEMLVRISVAKEPDGYRLNSWVMDTQRVMSEIQRELDSLWRRPTARKIHEK